METTIKLKSIVEYFSTINWNMTFGKLDNLSVPTYFGKIPNREMRPLNELKK